MHRGGEAGDEVSTFWRSSLWPAPHRTEPSIPSLWGITHQRAAAQGIKHVKENEAGEGHGGCSWRDFPIWNLEDAKETLDKYYITVQMEDAAAQAKSNAWGGAPSSAWGVRHPVHGSAQLGVWVGLKSVNGRASPKCMVVLHLLYVRTSPKCMEVFNSVYEGGGVYLVIGEAQLSVWWGSTSAWWRFTPVYGKAQTQ